MKQVTLTDAPEGQSFVVVGETSYERNVPVVVSDSEAKGLEAEGCTFKVQDAPKDAKKKQEPQTTDLGGTGGSGPARPTVGDDLNPNTP